MARILTTGFELRDAQAEGFSTAGAGITADTAVKRTGLVSAKFVGASYMGSIAEMLLVSTTGYFRTYFQASAWTTHATDPAAVFCFGGAVTVGIGVDKNGLCGPIKRDGGALAFTGLTTQLALNKWYRLEMNVTRGVTRRFTFLEVKVDGVLVDSWTGTTGDDGAFQAGVMFLGDQSSAGGGTFYFDDVAANDTSGSNQTGYPGPGKVYLLLPASDPGTSSVQWTKPGGSTANRHTPLDDNPPVYEAYDSTSGSAEDYLRNDGSTANAELNLTLQSYTAVGVAGRVVLVQPVAITGSSSATDTAGDIGLSSNPSIAQASFAAFDNGVASSTSSTWVRQVGTVTYNPTVTPGTGPVMQIRKVTATTRNATVNAIGLTVEEAPPLLNRPRRPVTTASLGGGTYN